MTKVSKKIPSSKSSASPSSSKSSTWISILIGANIILGLFIAYLFQKNNFGFSENQKEKSNSILKTSVTTTIPAAASDPSSSSSSISSRNSIFSDSDTPSSSSPTLFSDSISTQGYFFEEAFNNKQEEKTNQAHNFHRICENDSHLSKKEDFLLGLDSEYVSDPSKEAFVTLLTSDSYVAGVLAWIQSLKQTNTTRKLVIMYTEDADISPVIIDSMKNKMGAELILVETIYFNSAKNMFIETYTKFNIFKLIQFNKVIFLDADIVILKNIDHLFSVPAPAASLDIYLSMQNRFMFNSGVMVLSPSIETFNEIIKFIDSKMKNTPPDKHVCFFLFLSSFFFYSYHIISIYFSIILNNLQFSNQI